MNQRTAEMIRTIYDYVQHEHATSLIKKRLTHDEQAQGRCDVARLIEARMNEYTDVLAEAGAENRITEFIETVAARWAACPS